MALDLIRKQSKEKTNAELEATQDDFGTVKKSVLYYMQDTIKRTAGHNGDSVLAKTLPAGNYRFTLSGFMTGDTGANCIATMNRAGSTFYPPGGSDYVNRAHLSQSQQSGEQSSQSLTFIYNNPSEAEFKFVLGLTGTSEIGNLFWSAELLDDNYVLL